MNSVLKKVSDALVWMLRGETGVFPFKVRITLFFKKDDGSTHFHEHEAMIDVDTLEDAWWEHQKETVAKDVEDYINGDNHE